MHCILAHYVTLTCKRIHSSPLCRLRPSSPLFLPGAADSGSVTGQSRMRAGAVSNGTCWGKKRHGGLFLHSACADYLIDTPQVKHLLN
ncbi:hypothetical protein AB205_0133220 [Aquarana catesbeiana]|uniref:Uncharacterized protein n=1 Tax=Aquarana catesbeiana TaxID=8400 RepID=A0A2G9RHA7_AQUCT|nr:hypothetical protein AB205_0133220 [Aquarana catesbeiana]